jgi:lantibiotic leader peptide-processing serine protease
MRKLMRCGTVLAGVLAMASSQAAMAERGARSGEFVVVYRDTATLQQGRQAVRAAGGTIVSENAAIGVAKVRSRDARFIANAAAQRALDGAARNRMIGHSPGDDRPPRSEVEREQGGRFGHGRHGGSRLEPLAPLQWDMRMIDATPDGSYAVEQGSHKVEVGIIDTGVQGDHPDIRPNFDTKLSRNFAPDIPSIDGPCEEEPDHSCDDPADVDDGGHGTHVAGTVGAALNGVGIGGVAPRADLVALTAGQDSGFFFVQPTVDALTTRPTTGSTS